MYKIIISVQIAFSRTHAIRRIRAVYVRDNFSPPISWPQKSFDLKFFFLNAHQSPAHHVAHAFQYLML